MPLELSTFKSGDVVVLFCRGELRSSEVDVFLGKITSIMRETPRIVVEFSGVHKIDSRGVGILFSAVQKLRGASGDLRVAGLADQTVKYVLDITKFTDVCKVFETQEEAISSFSPLGRDAS